MAAKPIATDAFTSQLAGMSKTQLYDIMSQMKNLIEQNQQQARQILVENPLLTKALFQAQIMLGMVQPPQVMPSIQQPLPQPQQQPIQQSQLPPSIQSATQPPSQSARIGQASSSQPQNLSRPPHENQLLATLPTASLPIPGMSLPSQTALQQPRVQMNAQASSIPSHPSQVHSGTALPLHAGTSQPSALQAPHISSQGQQGLQTPGMLHQSLQPPLPLPPRPSSSQSFPQQVHTQMGSNLFHTSQPSLPHFMYPSGSILQATSVSFSQGQPPLPGQLPPQQLYQGGNDYGSSQGMNSMQIDRGTSWLSGLPDASAGARLPGPPPFIPSQMGSNVPAPNVPPSNDPPSRPPLITPEMEKALIQQVMSLKPDQINLLPPEQRQQVLQLQQMLR